MEKKGRVARVALVLTVFSGLAFAQTGQAPKPGDEHKKLGYFVGKWNVEGEISQNPFMPAGKFTSTENCEWFEGGYAVVCRGEGRSPMGSTKGLAILSYSTEEHVYTYYGVENSPMTMVSVPRGKIQGDTWTFEDEAKMGGKMVKSRYTIKETSPTSYTFTWEMVGDDGTWKTVVTGKETKGPRGT